MALMHLNYYSDALRMNTDVNIFIPTPAPGELFNEKDYCFCEEGKKYQVLYLLHGTYGDYSDWCRQTSIERYAQKYKLAVIMPSCANSYYYDMLAGPKYYTYLTEELPSFLSLLLPLSNKREDNFIAGLSMGGYGAWYLAISKPSMFSAAANLSGDLDLLNNLSLGQNNDCPWPFPAIFKDSEPDIFCNSENNLFVKLQNQINNQANLPRLFQSIGSEDSLFKLNQKALKKILDLGIDITQEVHPGGHNWDYWDLHIQRVLQWFQLKGTAV